MTLLVGDYAKSVTLQRNSLPVDVTAYSQIKIRISDSKDNLLRKYALVSEAGYTDLTLTGTDQINYSLFREDLAGLSPSSNLTVELLLITPNASHKDGLFISPISYEIGPISKITAHTSTDEY